MELRHIRYFIRVAELLHFTRAAESLYISQPTLSTHIRQLEEEIGCALFERGRTLRLTESGRLFLDRARDAIRALERGKEEIADLKGLFLGSLSIGLSYLFGAKIPAVLAAYSTAHPDVHVAVKLGTSHDIEQGVLDRSVDIGFAFLPPESDEIEYETLFSDEVILAVPKDHPLARETQLPVRELNGLPVILPSRGFSLRRFIDLYFAKEKIFPKVLLEINDVSALLAIAETGRAGAITARWAAAGRPGLHIISLSGASLSRSVGILKHQRVPLSAAGQAFVKLIRTHFQKV
jgi:LysR family cyn operon transcriptional activator